MNVTVFASAKENVTDFYGSEVTALCQSLGKAGCDLVYGGTDQGLMRCAAEGFLKEGRSVTGVYPRAFRAKADPDCTKTIETEDLAGRKDIMRNLADGFLALPGGVGTLDEIFEVLAVNQVSFGRKKITLYNLGGFYNSLDSALREMYQEGFISEDPGELYLLSEDMTEITEYLTRSM